MTALFVPPGSTPRNPLPLGHAAPPFIHGWVVKVVSATLDATAQVVAIPGNRPPPPGAQDTLVNLSATYTGGGSSVLDESGDRFQVVGAHDFAYGDSWQLPPPPAFPFYANVFSGQTVSGNVVYQIASNDASSLLLRADSFRYGYVWFALR